MSHLAVRCPEPATSLDTCPSDERSWLCGVPGAGCRTPRGVKRKSPTAGVLASDRDPPGCSDAGICRARGGQSCSYAELRIGQLRRPPDYADLRERVRHPGENCPRVGGEVGPAALRNVPGMGDNAGVDHFPVSSECWCLHTQFLGRTRELLRRTRLTAAQRRRSGTRPGADFCGMRPAPASHQGIDAVGSDQWGY